MSTIQTLKKQHRNLLREARAKINSLKDDSSKDEARKIGAEYDSIIERADALEDEIDRLADPDDAPDPRRPRNDGIAGAWLDEDDTRAAVIGRETRLYDRALSRGADAAYAPLKIGAFLRAMVCGARNDLEKRALGESTDSTGGFATPELLSAQMIDRLRAKAVVFQAGAMIAPLGSDKNHIANLLTDPIPAWRAENAAVAESDPTFGRITFAPKSLSVLIKVSRELLEDSLNIEAALNNALTATLALELDRVALFGSGVDPQPKGVVNFAGLTTNSFAGGALASYAPLITARTALRLANSDATAFVLSPRDEGKLAGLADTTGQPLAVPRALETVPMLTTTAVPVDGGVGTNESSIIAGDFSRLIVGIRSDIRIEVLRERYADNMQYGFLAHLRADIAAEHEAAFTVLGGVTP